MEASPNHPYLSESSGKVYMVPALISIIMFLLAFW